MPSPKEPDETYTEEEATRRMEDALRRALTAPPKPLKDIVGKRKIKSLDTETKE